jgi:hypothetical protein
MWFMAARAAGVTRLYKGCLLLVTVVATDFFRLWMMREPAVAAHARLMSLVRRNLLDSRRVTRLTGRHVAEQELECVRLVTANAGGSAVRAAV